jgi:cytoskeletal protein RodZ
MELDDKNRIADQWLDAAIQQYAAPEPDSGLEERIRRNLRTAVPEKKTGWHLWTPWVVATAIALMVAGILIYKAHRDTDHIAVKNTSVPPVARSQEALPATPVLTSSTHAEKKSPHAVARIAQPQWPEHFPSSRPLSQQEQFLADYVRDRPQEARLVARARAEQQERDMLDFKKRTTIPENLLRIE